VLAQEKRASRRPFRAKRVSNANGREHGAGTKEVFLEAIFRMVSRIQKRVVGSYSDGTYACSGAEASVNRVSFDARSVARITEPGLRHIAPRGATKRLLCGVDVPLGFLCATAAVPTAIRTEPPGALQRGWLARRPS
jgi:hypothetical protein